MNSQVKCLLFLILLLPALCFPFEYRLEGNSIVRFEEESTPGFEEKKAIPATQFIGFELSRGNLSFHLYGWGRAELADRSTNRGDTAGDLSYGYLAYKFPTADAQVKLGRMWIFEGAAREQLDGVYGRTDIGRMFTLAVFGGAPVSPDHNDNKGDHLFGGRISYRAAGKLELGVSGVREGGTDTGVTGNLKDHREVVGGDIWLSPHRHLDISGHTLYNVATGGIAEHDYLLVLRPSRPFTFGAEYHDYRFQDYFASTNLRSLFNPDSRDELQSYGLTATVSVAAPVDLIFEYKRYDREQLGESDRYGAEARMILADNRVRSGLSYHRSDGADAINSFHQIRGYALYDPPRYFTSLDVISDFYDDPVFGEDIGYEVLASVGYRPVKAIALSGDFSYSKNPWYDEEIRGVVRLTLNLSGADKGARK